MRLKDYSETTPFQYEDGKTIFMGMEIIVDPRVLIPRPETELLVNRTAELAEENGITEPRVLEIGTGSGVIALGLVKIVPGCSIVSADVSLDALTVAEANIAAHGAGGLVELVHSDMFSAFGKECEGGFDIIVSNPPYVSDKDYEACDAWVKAEPRTALRGGVDGMDYLRIIAGQSRRYLKKGGFVSVETGYDQAEKVAEAFVGGRLSDIRSFVDFNGYRRVVAGFKRG